MLLLLQVSGEGNMKVVFIFVLVLGLTFALGKWLGSEKKAGSSDLVLNSSLCDPTISICEFKYGQEIFNIEFQGLPSGLVPFDVLVNSKTIHVDSTQVDSIELSFDMKGMDMGYNVHKLNKSGSGWNAKVILPICSLARNDWVVNVKVVIDNEPQITEFRFSQSEQ